MTDTPALLELFGRTHVALVHFPIALLVVGAALSVWPRREGTEQAARWCLSLGLLGAMAAATSGWVLASSEEESDTLRWHRALSLLGTGVALFTWLCTRVRVLDRAPLRRGAALLAALVVGFSSHLGGELVHGANWYTAPFEPERATAPAPPDNSSPPTSAEPAAAGPAHTEPAPAQPAPSEPAPAPAPAAPRIDFTAQVLPILQARCIECHGAAKVRGKLRLDTREQVFDPARRSQWVIEPGRPQTSELMRRVTLPEDDDDRMPNRGQPLEPAQIETLRAWIEQGADWPSG